MGLVNIVHKPSQWSLRNRNTYDFKTRIQSPTTFNIPDSAIFIDNVDITISFFIRVISGSEEIFKKGTQNLAVSELGLSVGLTYHVVVNADFKIFINAIEQATTKNIDWSIAGDVIFGIFSGSDPANYDISNIVFFNKVLSDSEVYNIFSTAGSFNSSLHVSVIGYYPLNSTTYMATDLVGQYYVFDVVEQYNYAKVTALEANHATFRVVNLSMSVLAMTNQSINFSGNGVGYLYDLVTGINGGIEGNYDLDKNPFDTTFGGTYTIGEKVFLDFVFDNNNDLTTLDIADNFILQDSVLDLSQLNKLIYFQLYITGGDLNQIIFPRTLPSDSFTTQILLRGSTIEGTLDLSPLQTLGNLYVSDASAASTRKITNIKFPSSSKDLTVLYLDGAPLSGTIDLSTLSLGKIIEICFDTPNPLITEIILPTTFTQALTNFYAVGSSIKELDLSRVDFSGRLDLTYCNLLENIYFPTFVSTSTSTTFIEAEYTAITGILDLSLFSTFGSSNYFQYCVNLRGFIFPNTTELLGYFYINYSGVEGVLDMTNIVDAGIYRFNNTHITDLKFAINSTFSTLNASRCNLTGSIDLTPLTGLIGTIDLSYNKNLIEVILN
ncbi:MAG: hypothetical protein ACC656_02545, partial [Candidatus Heimdallarchaeota archaeon]